LKIPPTKQSTVFALPGTNWYALPFTDKESPQQSSNEKSYHMATNFCHAHPLLKKKEHHYRKSFKDQATVA